MIGNVFRDGRGKIIDETVTVSAFMPPQGVVDLTKEIRDDYSTGHNNLHRPFEEFNDKSLVILMNDNQRAFNSYVSPASQNPDEAWRAQTVRPLTRNKIISIAAHVTATITVPDVVAQNDKDDEDKEAAFVMKDLMEWVVENSDYEESFLFAVIGALVNPVVILKAEFREVMQRIKVKAADGTMTKKEVMDEVLSGFKTMVIPADEFLISNFYEYELQRQRFIIRRRFIEYDEAVAEYGGHENFNHVRPGVNVFFSDQDGLFYEQLDTTLDSQVEEVIYYNRLEDMEVAIINGIYMGDTDTEANRMSHRDTQDRPKYPFAKGGYEPIDEKHFFYYKAAVSKLGPDQQLVDTLYNMILDGTFLSLMPPINVFGEEDIDSSIVYPGVTNMFNKSTKVETMETGKNLSAGFNALTMVEGSMAESSQDALQAGIAPNTGRTAFEISQVQENARIQLGLFGKMIAQLVMDFGDLMVDDIVNHMTVAQVEEVTAGTPRLKFRNFLLPNRIENGRDVSRKIVLSDEMFGKELGEEERLAESFKVAEEQGGLDSEMRLIKVNPALFRRLRFMLTMTADAMLPKNEFLQKALNLEAYDRMIGDPNIDQRAVARDFLVETFAEGDADKYMKKQSAVLGLPGEQPAPEGAQPRPGGGTSAMVENLVGTSSMSNSVTRV